MALFRKDCILVKKQILFMFLFQMVVTPFLLSRMEGSGVIGGYLIFFLVQYISVLVIQNSISVVETADERAISYLCTLPYKRTGFVREKYFMDIVLVVAYCVIYFVEEKFLTIVPKLELWMCAVCILIVFMYRAVYIPLEYKFGYEKTKYTTTIFGLLVPFGLSALLSKLNVTDEMIIRFEAISEMEALFAVVLCIVFVTGVSMFIASKIFREKDL